MDLHSEERLGKAYDLRLIRRLWDYIRPYRSIFTLSILCLCLTSAFMLLQPYLLKMTIDQYVARGRYRGVTVMGLLFAGAVAGEFLFYYGQYYFTMLVAQRSLADLRLHLFSHVMKLPVAFFDRSPVGRLVTRLTTDVDVVNEMFAAGALTIVMDFLTLAAIAVVMLVIDLRLALVTLSLLPFMAVAINFFRLMARKTYRLIRERIARLNSYLQEALSGMTVIQLFAREEKTFAEFVQLNRAHRDANHLSNVYEAALFSLVEAVSSISIALMVWYGGGQIVQGAVAIGTLVAFIEYLQKFFIPVRDFSTKYAVMQSAMAATERVFQLLDTPVTVTSRVVPRNPARVAGAVEFDRVWFAYKREEYVLRGVSLRVEAGEKIAIVGATGAGKTTLIKLLNRFYDVSRGRIVIDGIDVREWDVHALRRRIGVVLQDVFLFTGDIARNISLGREDVSPADVERAAHYANAHRFIQRYPRGYGEKVRERGSNLSAGQRQLLAFARALAYNPAILVLDEATSSVDTETELLIQDALAKLMRDRTTLVIAHRLSTIENADRIVVLHKGEIREVGTHEELLQRRGIYWRLYQLQYRMADLRTQEVGCRT